MERLTALVSADPSFAAMVLRTVNNAQYSGSRRQPITDLHQAATRLGVRTLRNLAVCQTARSCAAASSLKEFDLEGFWEDSVRRAVAAEALAEHVERVDPQTAFTVGLLMEIGVLGLIVRKPSQAASWASARDLEPSARLTRERVLFGADHTEVNAQLAREWELPDELAMPMAHHHAPEEAPEPMRALTVLAGAAESLAGLLSNGDKRSAMERARRQIERLLPNVEVEALAESLGERVREAAGTLGIRVGPQPSLHDILIAANQRLVDLNLSYEDLVRRLEAAIAEKEVLAAELDRRNAELQRLSVTDPLTGLPNRRELFRRLTEELTRVQRHGGSLVLIVADVDHFKRANDSYGHVFGDAVLADVGAALSVGSRANDVIARTGGEEFAAVLPATDARGGAIAAERMREAVEKIEVLAPNRDKVQVTASLGVAWITGPHRGPVDFDGLATHMYDSADQAMYASKQSGRNRVTVAAEPAPWTAKLAS